MEARIESLEKDKAYTVWSKMKKSRTLRRSLIDSTQLQIERLRSRLQTQKKWLLESQWKSETSLEKLCGNLKVTVEDIEEHKWMIDVWGRKQEPWHAKSKKKAHRGEQTDRTRPKDSATDRVVIPQSDRFSASPPPAEPEDTTIIYNQDDVYEADNEEFHTPVGSPDAMAGAEEVVADEEQASSPFVVHDDTHLYGDAELGDEQGEGAPPLRTITANWR